MAKKEAPDNVANALEWLDQAADHMKEDILEECTATQGGQIRQAYSDLEATLDKMYEMEITSTTLVRTNLASIRSIATDVINYRARTGTSDSLFVVTSHIFNLGIAYGELTAAIDGCDDYE